MKRIFYLIPLMFLAAACGDRLEVQPEQALSSTLAFDDENTAMASLLGVYCRCQDLEVFGSMPQIIADYHRVMDQQRPEGRRVTGTRTGRYLLTQIPSAGAKIIAAGASDWVVFPHDQKYAEQEDYFLHSIINTISDTLHEQTSYPIKSWLDERHQQINRGELVYIAHQLDVLGEQS